MCRGFYVKGAWSCCGAKTEQMPGCTPTESWKAAEGDAATVYNNVADVAVPVVVRPPEPIPGAAGGGGSGGGGTDIGVYNRIDKSATHDGSGGGSGSGGGGNDAYDHITQQSSTSTSTSGGLIYSNADSDSAADTAEVIYEAFGSSDEEDDGGDGGGGASNQLYSVPKGKGKDKGKGKEGGGTAVQADALYAVPTSKADRASGGAASSGPTLPPRNQMSEQQRNIQNWITSNAGRDDAAEALGSSGKQPKVDLTCAMISLLLTLVR